MPAERYKEPDVGYFRNTGKASVAAGSGGPESKL